MQLADFPPLARPNDEVRIGVVGAGRVARVRHLPILSAVEDATVAFVADLDVERAGELARAYGCRSIGIDTGRNELPECDAVVLAIPPGTREAYVDAFGRRDVPVLCEKPFAPDLETHRRLLRAHDTVACNYMRTNYANVRLARRLTGGEPFGALERVEFREAGKLGAIGLTEDHYQTAPDSPGAGILMERGCHSLSQVLALFPQEELVVRESKLSRTEGIVTDVRATLRARPADVDVECRFSAIEDIGSQVRLRFEHATVAFDPNDGSDLSVTVSTDRGTETLAVDTDEAWAESITEAMYLRWRQFLRMVREPADVDTVSETGLGVSQLIAGIREHDERGER